MSSAIEIFSIKKDFYRYDQIFEATYGSKDILDRYARIIVGEEAFVLIKERSPKKNHPWNIGYYFYL